MAEPEAELLQAEIAVAALERIAAKSQLAALGINASPADVSAWLSMTPKAKRRAALDYAVLISSESWN